MDSEELKKLAYVQKRPTDGRTIIATVFYQDGQFHIPYERGEGLFLMKSPDGQRTVYMAQEPADSQADLRLRIAELIFQQTPLGDGEKVAHAIATDFMNFGASLEKLDLIFEAGRHRLDATLLVATELEFLFYNVRSVYDQLQRLIASIWEGTRVEGREKQQLPSTSFRKVVSHGKPVQRRSAEQISERYGLPPRLADFYQQETDFLLHCKAIRDSVTHWGRSFSDGPIFVLEEGFAVDTTAYPYSKFDCWQAPHATNAKFGSVRALIAHVAERAIRATEQYVDALQSCTALPESTGPDWHAYVRHPYVAHLVRLRSYVADPWRVADADV